MVNEKNSDVEHDFLLRYLGNILNAAFNCSCLPTAADGACIAGLGPNDMIDKGLCIDTGGVFRCILLPVSRWERPGFLG